MRSSEEASAGVDFSFGFDTDSGYRAPALETESSVPAPVGSDAALWETAAHVADPEIPVLSIADLGILRAAYYSEDGVPQVVITPTYSGCPAMDAITSNIRSARRSTENPTRPAARQGSSIRTPASFRQSFQGEERPG